MDNELAKISDLINYAIRMRSSNYSLNLDRYSQAVDQLQARVEKYTSSLPRPKHNQSKSYESVEKLAEFPAKLEEETENMKEKLRLKLPWLEDEEKEKEELNVEEEVNKEAEETKIQRVLKRYEKTFGKAKLLEQLKPVKEEKRPETPKTRQEVVKKLQSLEREEKLIRDQKEELNKLLELKSQTSMGSSRQATVYSVSTSKRPQLPQRKPPRRKSEVFVTALPKTPKKPSDPVAELIKNL